MPTLIKNPTAIKSTGTKPKTIQEFAGRINSKHTQVSVARMTSPEGWEERPEFEEITLVLRGMLRVDYEDGQLDVYEGQMVVTKVGEWIKYSTPQTGGAEYIAVCVPAFSPETVHRDSE